MRFICKTWNTYRELILRNCTDELVADTSLTYWQNRLFAASVTYLIPFSVLAVIPGVYMAYINELQGILYVDFVSIVLILSIAFLPGINVFTRKLIFNGALYLISVALLLYLGLHGPGLLYLLAITIFVVLSLDKKYGYFTLALNCLICIAIGVILHFDWIGFGLFSQYALDSWIAVSMNLIFLSGVAVILIPILFDGLQSTIIQENNLRAEVESQHRQLKESISLLDSKNQELERFAYTISHDLKEPLRMISSFMQLLEKKYGAKLDEKAHQYIHFAVDGAQRMNNSIIELIEYSRVGRLYNEYKPVDINQVISETIQSLKADVDNSNAKITYPKMPTLNVVPVTFKMLIQNLLTNALKYQPDEQAPVIEIDIQELDSQWQFSIKDNGIGISKEHQEEIFEIFKRLHSREKYQGTGMGLAISKKIVEQHGGKIWVESEVGKGSEFYFTIEK
ncbi:MAG: ATP-binding protein [Gracilimonas sp.]